MPQISSAAASWISAHPQFNTDQAYRAAAIGADAIAKRRGIRVDSPEYFEFIEEQLGERTPVEEDEPAPRRAASTSTAMAPSRSTPAAGGGGKVQRFSLTAAEKDMADATMRHISDPVTRYKRYAENKIKMMAENPLVQ